MPRKSSKAKLNLSVEQKDNLIKLSQARTASFQEVQRSSILLKYAEELEISAIAKELNTTRVTVYKCIDKALSMGIEAALKDTYHRPYGPIITEEAKSWVISLACTKPKDLGYAAEFWTR
ncbi:MAG: IS630 family transposase, partial [bacterium]|nr:IS630 family transposase [bacterium]